MWGLENGLVIVLLLLGQEGAFLLVEAFFRCCFAEKEVLTNTGLLSYEIVSTAVCVYFAVTGCKLWFSDEIREALPDHLNGYWEPAERIILVGTAYQLWDLAAALRLPSMRKPETIFHHAMAAAIAAFALVPYYHYYAVFYIGVPEVSAVFLFPVSVFKMFPDLRESFPVANFVFRCLFAIAHFVFRLGMWPLVTFHLVQDSVHALRTGQAAHPILSVLCMVVFIPMTALQVYWGALILKMGHRTFLAMRGQEAEPSSPMDVILERQQQGERKRLLPSDWEQQVPRAELEI
eukprot:GGOE01000834.1.p1 GENE.GGOE01000834.1~~GGOE01000834.1.p1  ORF type:complete len:291 (+),score=92.99 GGOE01000834.1:58-930(+)